MTLTDKFLTDVNVKTLKPGFICWSSRSDRGSENQGCYTVDDSNSGVRSDRLFPAIVLKVGSKRATVLTPTGVYKLSNEALVSIPREEP